MTVWRSVASLLASAFSTRELMLLHLLSVFHLRALGLRSFRWVDENMLRTQPMPCTALELYAARCGILHTFTPDSDLSRKGSVRKIIYAWGTAKAEDLSKAANLLERAEVAIHISELIESFREGLASYFDVIVHSPGRLQRIEESTDLWFTHLDQGTIAKFLDASLKGRTDGPEM
jgi:hypothetical protein